jgi:DNA-binding MarR family transcriptional regulator
VAQARKRLREEDYRLLAEFRHLVRQFLSFSEKAAAGAGLAPQRHQALLAVKGMGGAATVGALAERLYIRPNSAVGLVNRLVAARLLKRGSDRTDRRRVILTLTPGAEKMLEALTAAHRDELSRLAPLLGPLLAQLQD